MDISELWEHVQSSLAEFGITREGSMGTSLEIQQLRFCAFTVGGAESISGWEVGELRSHMSHSTAKKKRTIITREGSMGKHRNLFPFIRTEVHIGDFLGNIHFWSFWASLMASGTRHGRGEPCFHSQCFRKQVAHMNSMMNT